MNIGQAIASYFKNYANFKGRARRSEYWWASLFIGVVTMIVSAVTMQTVLVETGAGTVPVVTYGPLFYIWALAIFLPSLALTVRRLHDTGRAGTYYFMALIPLAGPIILLIELVKDSQPGANAYGNPVK